MQSMGAQAAGLQAGGARAGGAQAGGVPMQARRTPMATRADPPVADAGPGRRRLVVVGNGMAGARAIEEVLSRGGDEMFDITVFGAEPYGNYNRILLSNVLSGAHDAADIFINPLAWYEENAITLHAGVRAIAIDRAARIVTGEGGVVAPYDVLLIATGSRSFIPPLQGLNGADGRMRPGVFGFRTLDDCGAIVAAAATSGRAAVIGGGLLGLEAARGLMNHGCEVHVVHLGKHLMEAQLDATGGEILRAAMEAMGVRIHLETQTAAIVGEDRVTGLAFKDGATLDCDMVVVSAGIRANVEIGRECGLSVERAILVDDAMRSVDDPAIYVVGECAQHRGRVYGLVAPLWEQARVFADHVTGVDPDSAYTGSKLATKLKVMGVELASMGLTEPADERDEVVQFTEARRGTYKKLIVRDGRLVGGILMGDISKAAYLMQAFDRDSPLPHERLSLLFDMGAPAQAVTLDEMPPSAQICNCNGVSKATLGACVEAGERDARAVMAATRAGMGCGSCKGLVGEVVAWFAARADAAAPGPEEGAVSLMPRMVDGLIEVEELMRIGAVAKKYNVARVRLGEGHRIDFAGLSAEDGALLRAELERA